MNDDPKLVAGPLATVGAVLVLLAWRRRSPLLTLAAGLLVGLGLKLHRPA